MGLTGSCGPQPQGRGSDRETPSKAIVVWFSFACLFGLKAYLLLKNSSYPKVKSFQRCISVLGMQKSPGPNTAGKRPVGPSFNPRPRLKWSRQTRTPGLLEQNRKRYGSPWGTPGTGRRPF